ncbi:LysR family transcriptional regulator [Stella humosa]|uniref:LysR family transcriptional regulator n=1 Tax=Stella humosa TaxID=94 RepID=A0A3N1L0N2_9PROT|nr:LysR family transcriptional regulator [Stella humosa]ROP84589.1 LysR family transcriptional regulator [Stella humosa]BBK34109.1 LysR family transcriptional regulator [Stella humosa]
MERRQHFRAMQAFEAVTRHLSVTRAADELGVSQSAISHQLRQLSEVVGERLVERRGRGIVLTVAGDRLARRLQPAFAEIERSMSEAIGGTRDTVRLAICSSFGPGWLVPRLSRFYAAHPGLPLQLCMYARDPELTDAVADAFVTTLPREKGFLAQLLWRERLVPVAARACMTGPGQAIPLITTDLQPGTVGRDWKSFAALNGADAPAMGEKPWRFASHYLIALEMVRAGLGAALVPDFLVQRDIEGGSLVRLPGKALPTREDYFLCIKESRRAEPMLAAVLDWFAKEAETDRNERAG